MEIKRLHLHMFDIANPTGMNPQTTGLNDKSGYNDLSPEMKTYYSKYLIANAEPELYHDQFGQKHPIPQNGGKNIEFRRYKSLGAATTPLTEGVTPNGQKLHVSTVEATVAQYGGYIVLSDMLMLTAIDNNMLQATELLGAQAGLTSDRITRSVLEQGSNRIWAQTTATGTAPQSRSALATAGNKLGVYDIRRAVKALKKQNAKPFADGSYVGILSPDTSFDLMSDPAWIDASQYAGSTQIFNGEIGKLYGVRFVETTEAMTFTESSKTIAGTLVIGKDAYGVTEIEGGGLQHIVKQKGSAGTADPLTLAA